MNTVLKTKSKYSNMNISWSFMKVCYFICWSPQWPLATCLPLLNN